MTNQTIHLQAHNHKAVTAACAVIVFVRHPQLGKVKTRLAQTLGNEKALAIYKLLLQHTYSLVQNGKIPVYIYYTDAVVEDDLWQGSYIIKKQQQGADLGMRISHAFNDVFAAGHQKAIIIGSDCYELTASILIAAFNALEQSDAVIGPATDGGYYLLGLTQPMPTLFEGIAWSTPTVAAATLAKLNDLQCSVTMLQPLNDIDEEKDLPEEIINQL
jgi:uncharacterized protein